MEKNKMLNLGLIAGLLIGLLVFIGGCISPEGAEGEFNWSIIIIFVLFIAMIYFLMIRPQRKRQKEHEQLTQELRKGDKVVTAGGIYGQIESLSEDSVVLKVESGATIRVTRSSIVSKRSK